MGYRRKCWENINKKKRGKNDFQTENKNRNKKRIKKSEYLPSKKADNRFVCLSNGKMKYQYATFEKALLACKYAPDPQRPYYCKACHAYHTTSQTKEEYYSRADENFRKRTGVEPLHSRLPDLLEHPEMRLK